MRHQCLHNFAWTRCLKHRAKLDGNGDMAHVGGSSGRVCVETVEAGQMTKSLAILVSKDQPWLTTEAFLDALDQNLQKKLA